MSSSSSEPSASPYITMKSVERQREREKKELRENVSLGGVGVGVSLRFHLRSTSFHFQLGAMMLLLFIRYVILSPSSSNIYAFYFRRHLFAAPSSCASSQYYSIHNCFIFLYLSQIRVLFPLCISLLFYLDQLFFGDTNIVITFDL